MLLLQLAVASLERAGSWGASRKSLSSHTGSLTIWPTSDGCSAACISAEQSCFAALSVPSARPGSLLSVSLACSVRLHNAASDRRLLGRHARGSCLISHGSQAEAVPPESIYSTGMIIGWDFALQIPYTENCLCIISCLTCSVWAAVCARRCPLSGLLSLPLFSLLSFTQTAPGVLLVHVLVGFDLLQDNRFCFSGRQDVLLILTHIASCRQESLHVTTQQDVNNMT